MNIVDLSQEIFKGQPVYGGHQPTVVFPMTKFEEKPDGKWSFAVNTLLVSEHAGTHSDSFTHTSGRPEALSIEKLPLEKFMGPAVCLDVSHVPASEFITMEVIQTALEQSGNEVRRGDTVLLYTAAYVKFFPTADYNLYNPGLNREALEWMADQGIVNIGIDAVSIDVSPHKGSEWKPAHNVCNERQIINTENLGDLRPVAGKRFYYIGLPLKVRGGTAGLTRAVAILGAENLEEVIHNRR